MHSQYAHRPAAVSAPPHHASSTASSASNASSCTSTLTSSSTATTSSSLSSATTTPPTTPLLPFYWNPAVQQQQQQLLQLQQAEETPKICNHSKRRYSDATTPSSSPRMELDRTESTNSLDCQSLQRSLKRVRLSSSPGELRLQLDLRQLAQSNEWVQSAEDVWLWPRTKCRLEQSPVDPLQLIFHLPCPGSCQSTTRVWIQIPRMYAHRPPIVTQIQHAVPSLTPLSNIQSIHISTEVPVGDAKIGGGGGWSHGSLTGRLDATRTVLTVGPWTCVLRLTDILEFLCKKFVKNTNNPDALWSTAPPMPDTRDFLTPNRFDLGYYKGNANAMDLKE